MQFLELSAKSTALRAAHRPYQNQTWLLRDNNSAKMCELKSSSLEKSSAVCIPYSVSHLQADQAHSTIWVTLKSAHTSELPLTLWVCYVPPQSNTSAYARFQHLSQVSASGHVLLAGDFNSRVGSCSQPWVSELGIPVQLQSVPMAASFYKCARTLL